MSRRMKMKNKTNNDSDNIMTDSLGDWKKGQDVWFTSYHGELKYGTIMYFSENRESGKKWVTLWDLTNPRYESAPIETLALTAPSKSARDKVLRLVARAKRQNAKKQ